MSVELSQKISLSCNFVYEPLDVIHIFNSFWLSGQINRNYLSNIKTVNNQYLIDQWSSHNREDLLAITYMIANNMLPLILEAQDCHPECFKNHVLNFVVKPFRDLLNHRSQPKRFYKTLAQIRNTLSKDYSDVEHIEYLITQIGDVLDARGIHY